MTEIYRYRIISIRGKRVVIRLWSGQTTGLAADLKVFWVSALFDFFKYGKSKESILHADLEKIIGPFDYINRYELDDKNDEKNFGKFVEEWQIDEVVRLNDELYWKFQNNNEGYWNTEAVYTVTFSDEKYLQHIKEGQTASGT